MSYGKSYIIAPLVEELEDEIKNLNDDIADLKKKNETLEDDNSEKNAIIGDMEVEIAELKAREQ